MTARSAKPLTVTLGALTQSAQDRVASGRFASVSEVVRAGLRALDREEAALDSLLKSRVEDALADTRPALSQADVFEALREHHEKREARGA